MGVEGGWAGVQAYRLHPRSYGPEQEIGKLIISNQSMQYTEKICLKVSNQCLYFPLFQTRILMIMNTFMRQGKIKCLEIASKKLKPKIDLC